MPKFDTSNPLSIDKIGNLYRSKNLLEDERDASSRCFNRNNFVHRAFLFRPVSSVSTFRIDILQVPEVEVNSNQAT
jgi:hypothetical protein